MYKNVKDIVGDEVPIAYHECGTPPNPDKCMSEGTRWWWWMEWHTGHLQKVDKKYLKFVYKDPIIITLDEIPDIMKNYSKR